MKYLLVGGERAGEMVDMGFPMDRIRIPARPAQQTTAFSDEAAEPTEKVIKEFNYNATTLVDCSGKRHTVYVLDGVDPLIELLRIYNGGAK